MAKSNYKGYTESEGQGQAGTIDIEKIMAINAKLDQAIRRMNIYERRTYHANKVGVL